MSEGCPSVIFFAMFCDQAKHLKTEERFQVRWRGTITSKSTRAPLLSMPGPRCVSCVERLQGGLRKILEIFSKTFQDCRIVLGAAVFSGGGDVSCQRGVLQQFFPCFTKASWTGCLVVVCERSERLGGLGGPQPQLVFRVGFGNVLQGYVPGGKWVLVRDYWPRSVIIGATEQTKRPGCAYVRPRTACSFWSMLCPKGTRCFQVILEPYCAQTGRMYGQRDTLGDINKFMDRWRVEKQIKFTAGEQKNIDRIDRQTDRVEADKNRL